MTDTVRREIVTTRVLDAPRELVLEAWSDPEHLSRWWGPKGFTNTFREFDLKPGASWRFVMHGPDGVNFENDGEFVELVRPERIVFRHLSPPRFQATVTLAEEAGGSRLTWRMLFDSATQRDNVARFAVEANEQNLDRLEAHLTGMARRP